MKDRSHNPPPIPKGTEWKSKVTSIALIGFVGFLLMIIYDCISHPEEIPKKLPFNLFYLIIGILITVFHFRYWTRKRPLSLAAFTNKFLQTLPNGSTATIEVTYWLPTKIIFNGFDVNARLTSAIKAELLRDTASQKTFFHPDYFKNLVLQACDSVLDEFRIPVFQVQITDLKEEKPAAPAPAPPPETPAPSPNSAQPVSAQEHQRPDGSIRVGRPII